MLESGSEVTYQRLNKVEEYAVGVDVPIQIFGADDFSSKEFNEIFEYNLSLKQPSHSRWCTVQECNADIGDVFCPISIQADELTYRHQFQNSPANPTGRTAVPLQFSKEMDARETLMNTMSVSMTTAHRRRDAVDVPSLISFKLYDMKQSQK